MADIIIVPTSHIAEESIKRVSRVIEEENPQCIAVELDVNRFIAMEEGEASHWQAIRAMGPWRFIVALGMKKLQMWLGKKVGIIPGADMRSAVKTAEKRGIAVEFIDRDMLVTLERLMGIPRSEKLKIIVFLIKGMTINRFLKAGKNINCTQEM